MLAALIINNFSFAQWSLQLEMYMDTVYSSFLETPSYNEIFSTNEIGFTAISNLAQGKKIEHDGIETIFKNTTVRKFWSHSGRTYMNSLLWHASHKAEWNTDSKSVFVDQSNSSMEFRHIHAYGVTLEEETIKRGSFYHLPRSSNLNPSIYCAFNSN